MSVVVIGWYDSLRFLQLGPWRQLFKVCLRKYVDSGSRVITKLQYLVGFLQWWCWSVLVDCFIHKIWSHHLTYHHLWDDVPSCLVSACILLRVVVGLFVEVHAGWEWQTEEKLLHFMHMLQWQLYAGQFNCPSGCGHVPSQLWHFYLGWFWGWWHFVSVLM